MNDRERKLLELRLAKQLLNAGGRLTWVRNTLGLLQKQVALDAGVSFSTYCEWEANVGTANRLKFLETAEALDKLWQERFKGKSYPSFEGRPVPAITVMWLDYGGDLKLQERDELIATLKLQMDEQEKEHAYKELEMKRQLSLFADEIK